MAAVKPGDYLTPKSLWNETTPTDKLAEQVHVLDVIDGIRSESGTLVLVETQKGEAWLDLHWFEETIRVGR